MKNTFHIICVKCVSNLLEHEYCDDNVEDAKICYGLESMLCEGIKLIIIMITFICTGYTQEIISCLLVTFLVRVYLGGVHVKTQWGCFCMSMGYYAVAVLGGKYINTSFNMMIIVCLVIVILILKYAPILSLERPIYSNKNIRNIKIKGIMGVLLIFFMVLVLPISQNHIVAIFILQIMEVVIIKLKEQIGRREVIE